MYEDVKQKEDALTRSYELRIAKMTNEIELLKQHPVVVEPCKKCEEARKRPDPQYFEGLMIQNDQIQLEIRKIGEML